MANVTPDQRDIFDIAESIEIPSSENVPWYKSVPSAIGRGLVEGGIKVNQLFTGGGVEALSPDYQKTQKDLKEQRKENLYEKYLPTDEGLLARGIQRGIESGLEASAFPSAAPLSVLGRGIAGGVAAEGAKDLGAPEFLQTSIEIAAQITPDLAKRILAKNPSQKELLDFARSQGMTEEQIALAIEKEGSFNNFLGKIASKGTGTQQKLLDTKQSIGNIYQNIRSTEPAKKALSGQQSSKFLGDLNDKLSKMPAEVRNKIATDFKDLLGTQMTGADLLDFHHKLNYYIQKGDRILGTLKEPISDALKQLSPDLAKDFGLANKLYSNYAKTAKLLKPNTIDKLIDYGKIGAAVAGLATGNMALIGSALGKQATGNLANQMLTNPRLQNLIPKLASSIKQGLIPVSNKIMQDIIREVAKDNLDAAKLLSEFDAEDFFKS